jgi:hypothetical protein
MSKAIEEAEAELAEATAQLLIAKTAYDEAKAIEQEAQTALSVLRYQEETERKRAADEAEENGPLFTAACGEQTQRFVLGRCEWLSPWGGGKKEAYRIWIRPVGFAHWLFGDVYDTDGGVAPIFVNSYLDENRKWRRDVWVPDRASFLAALRRYKGDSAWNYSALRLLEKSEAPCP